MNTIDWTLLLPALLAGLLVLASHVPLGSRVLTRGVIFADLAVAQMAGLGVISAELLGIADRPWLVQLVAAVSALIGAVLLTGLERWPLAVREASIGLLFVLAASGGILLLSRDAHAGEHLQDLLNGQILWVSPRQLWLTGGLTALWWLVWWRWQARLGHFGFYALFALAVTASVQLVGVYLVFASLIVPALATLRVSRWRTALALLIGLAGYGGGLLLSIWQDLPAGAAIIWVMTALAALMAAVNFSDKTPANDTRPAQFR